MYLGHALPAILTAAAHALPRFASLRRRPQLRAARVRAQLQLARPQKLARLPAALPPMQAAQPPPFLPCACPLSTRICCSVRPCERWWPGATSASGQSATVGRYRGLATTATSIAASRAAALWQGSVMLMLLHLAQARQLRVLLRPLEAQRRVGQPVQLVLQVAQAAVLAVRLPLRARLRGRRPHCTCIHSNSRHGAASASAAMPAACTSPTLEARRAGTARPAALTAANAASKRRHQARLLRPPPVEGGLQLLRVPARHPRSLLRGSASGLQARRRQSAGVQPPAALLALLRQRLGRPLARRQQRPPRQRPVPCPQRQRRVGAGLVGRPRQRHQRLSLQQHLRLLRLLRPVQVRVEPALLRPRPPRLLPRRGRQLQPLLLREQRAAAVQARRPLLHVPVRLQLLGPVLLQRHRQLSACPQSTRTCCFDPRSGRWWPPATSASELSATVGPCRGPATTATSTAVKVATGTASRLPAERAATAVQGQLRDQVLPVTPPPVMRMHPAAIIETALHVEAARCTCTRCSTQPAASSASAATCAGRT